MTTQQKNKPARLVLLGHLAIVVLAGLFYFAKATAMDPIDGLGGTGLNPGTHSQDPDGGVGGTGITSLGIVQDFGSIFVNGREYFLTPDTQVTINGRVATESALQRGDAVSVRGYINPASGRSEALQVNALDSLQGVVDQVDHQARSFTLLNQVVHRDDTTFGYQADGSPLALETLQPGDAVSIAAYAHSDGSWSATRVSRVPDTEATSILISGSVLGVDRQANLITVSNQVLSVRAGALPHDLTPGQWVHIRGLGINGSLHAESVQIHRPDLGAPGTRVELSGRVQTASTTEGIFYNGLALHYKQSTQWHSGAADQIHTDTPIALAGTVQADGSIRVDEIQVGVDLLRVNISASHNKPTGNELANKVSSANAGKPAQTGKASAPGLAGRPAMQGPVIQRPQIQRPHIPVMPKPNSPSLNRPVNPKK